MPKDWIFKIKSLKELVSSIFDHHFKTGTSPHLMKMIQKTILEEDHTKMMDLEQTLNLVAMMDF